MIFLGTYPSIKSWKARSFRFHSLRIELDDLAQGPPCPP